MKRPTQARKNITSSQVLPVIINRKKKYGGFYDVFIPTDKEAAKLTQEQKVIKWLETGKPISHLIAAHKLDIYSTFGNIISKLRQEYEIRVVPMPRKGKRPYMEYWGELEDD